MSEVMSFAKELEQEVRQFIDEKGVNFVRAAYDAPQDLDFDELVEFCVCVEYQNAFK